MHRAADVDVDNLTASTHLFARSLTAGHLISHALSIHARISNSRMAGESSYFPG